MLDALRAEKGIEVVYDSISDFITLQPGIDLQHYAEKYKDVDLIIYAGGISALLEGEEGDAGNVEGFYRGDRTTINLPAVQTQVMQMLQKSGKPMILYVCPAVQSHLTGNPNTFLPLFKHGMEDKRPAQHWLIFFSDVTILQASCLLLFTGLTVTYRQ